MTEHVDQERLTLAVVGLSARLDALTWAVGALIGSHPQPAAILAAWTARLDEAAAGGFETAHDGYRQRYVEELAKWTGTLEALAKHAGGRRG